MSEIDQNGDPPLHTPYTVIKQWPTRVGLSFLQPDPTSSSFALFRFNDGGDAVEIGECVLVGLVLETVGGLEFSMARNRVSVELVSGQWNE
ncbi:hypothetical protein AAC387_Pa03g1188 [Persea americana]